MTRKSGEPRASLKVDEVKKDKLFKPMFRSFRHYYQQSFERYAHLNLR